MSDYLFTPADAVRGVRALSWRHFAGFGVAAATYVGGARFVGGDVAFLVAGIAFMLISNATYRLPLVLAIIGLVLLMAMSPFVHAGNSLETFSEQVAVWVFFMLIFGVFRMIADEFASALLGGKKRVQSSKKSPKRMPQTGSLQNNTPQKTPNPPKQIQRTSQPKLRPQSVRATPQLRINRAPLRPTQASHTLQRRSRPSHHLDLSRPSNVPLPKPAPKPLTRPKLSAHLSHRQERANENTSRQQRPPQGLVQ